MEEKIKGIEVIAYKGMEFDMTCRDFQYEIGKTYKTNKVKLCKCGFHACLNPKDVLKYYSQDEGSLYFKVKLSGEIAKCGKSDTKVTATEITILEEITDTFNEVIKTTEWWKTENVLDLLYFSDGFAKVQRGDELWNFINKGGKYLSKEWFEWAENFQEGFAVVHRGDYKYNFIDKNGNYLSDEWFYNVHYFQEGFAIVQRGDELWNFINRQGNYLSDEWYKWVDDFKEGFARVQKANGEWAKIDKTGNLIKKLQ